MLREDPVTFLQPVVGLACAGALLFGAASACAAPGETLAQMKSRGTLRCGVSEGIPGFSEKDSTGHWSGFDVDFCRAVAAAALGDAAKVAFVPLKASARFPALQAGTIDLLVRNTTWTYRREASLKVRFAGVLLYDGQGFMVPIKNAPKGMAGLKGATVCVEKGTTSIQNLVDYSEERGLGGSCLPISRRSRLSGRDCAWPRCPSWPA